MKNPDELQGLPFYEAAIIQLFSNYLAFDITESEWMQLTKKLSGLLKRLQLESRNTKQQLMDEEKGRLAKRKKREEFAYYRPPLGESYEEL